MKSGHVEKESLWKLIKKGNKSSAIAMTGNAILAAIKTVAATMSGSGAMFASAMHSFADAINQAFVFIGSVLSEKKPTRRFPTGFGRVINIFCMIAVIVVSIMAYETILEGIHLIQHPVASGGYFWLSVGVLVINIVVDGVILYKAMKEILHEARVEAKGFGIVTGAFNNVSRSAPPTRLVFYEDLVAVTGAFLALIAIIITSFVAAPYLDGITTILIGILMVCVAFKVGYDNMIGLIGVAAPQEIETRISNLILQAPYVKDIYSLRIMQEGRYYHVHGLIELEKGLTLAAADDIKFDIRRIVLEDHDIVDVTFGIIEDDEQVTWTSNE
ncbi:cation diffusion facilitator family transporter [Paenibacillus crassostreae]|uniref:Cobalt transporter n=1 Tax=Paenibacillus crassostreae TaxID=1763538 RepID=A0A167DIT7_9BACL|nr:cation diffusion facilitator family transporter [Paenibacillus crassostreae]AOZ91419.1 cation transporter [Paenibacillus crassostreae]OAB74422.1 cobalt transporter [Paenibacillus crassostreae]